MFNEHLNSYITIIKDTHREYTPSKKIEVLTKSMNMHIWGTGTVNQPFVKVFILKLSFPKNEVVRSICDKYLVVRSK